MKRTILIALFLGLMQFLTAQKVTISGFVIDSSSGETLIGANIYDSATYVGTSTNNKGFYSLSLETGYRTIMLSYIGYETKSYRLYLKSDTVIKFALVAGIDLKEIRVTSFRTGSDFLKGRVTLPMITLQQMPALGGETDMIKALTTLPGIASANEGSSGMVVRGGGSDQNLL